MAIQRLLTQDVVVRRLASSTVDAEGNPLPSYTDSTYKGRLEQTATVEVPKGRTTVTSWWKLFLLPTAEIGPYDLVVADGITFEVAGEPALKRTPRGVHHQEIRLIRHGD